MDNCSFDITEWRFTDKMIILLTFPYFGCQASCIRSQGVSLSLSYFLCASGLSSSASHLTQVVLETWWEVCDYSPDLLFPEGWLGLNYIWLWIGNFFLKAKPVSKLTGFGVLCQSIFHKKDHLTLNSSELTDGLNIILEKNVFFTVKISDLSAFVPAKLLLM